MSYGLYTSRLLRGGRPTGPVQGELVDCVDALTGYSELLAELGDGPEERQAAADCMARIAMLAARVAQLALRAAKSAPLEQVIRQAEPPRLLVLPARAEARARA